MPTTPGSSSGSCWERRADDERGGRADDPVRPRRARPVRDLRRALRPRGADPGPRRARRGLGGASRRSRLPDGVRRSPAGLRRAPDPHHARPPSLTGARLRDLAEARGPGAHRRPQDQQRARAGAGREAVGQGAHHRGDRRRTTRRRGRHGQRVARPAVRRLHGRGRHPPAGAERRAHEAPGRRGRSRHGRHPHAQGGSERGAARLGRERTQHALHHRLGRRSPPVPGVRSRPAAGDRRRGAGAIRRTGSAATPTSLSPAWAAAATRSGCSRPSWAHRGFG